MTFFLVHVYPTFSLKIVVNWRRLSRFPLFRTLVHARALLVIEKSRPCCRPLTWNMKVCNDLISTTKIPLVTGSAVDGSSEDWWLHMSPLQHVTVHLAPSGRALFRQAAKKHNNLGHVETMWRNMLCWGGKERGGGGVVRDSPVEGTWKIIRKFELKLF